MDLPTAVEKYWAQIVIAVGGAWTALKFWSDQRAKRRETAAASLAARAVAKLDLTKLAQEAAADVIQTLREEVDHWTGEVAKLRDELREARREHAQVIAQKDAQIALLEGEKRQLTAKVEALQRVIVSHGWPEAKTFDALEVGPDGRLATMGSGQ